MARRIDDLPGTVRADQRDRLALVDVQRHALQRIDVIVVEFDVGDFQQFAHG